MSLGFWQKEHEYSFGSATRQFVLFLLSVYILGVGCGLTLINDRWCGGGTVSGLRRNYCTSPHHLTSNNFTNTNLHISTQYSTVHTDLRPGELPQLFLLFSDLGDGVVKEADADVHEDNDHDHLE